MMLFKEILEQPTRGPSNPRLKKPTRLNMREGTKTVPKRNSVALKKKATVLKKRSVNAFNQNISASKTSNDAGVVRKTSQIKSTTYDADIPSSTPIFTPIKKEKLISSSHEKKPVSISSSQCSLIELLQQYNMSALNKPQHDSSSGILEKTLTSVSDEECSHPQLQTFQEVLAKLQRTAKNSSSNDAIKQAFEDVKVAYESLLPYSFEKEQASKSLSDSNSDVGSSQVSFESLKAHNVSLQRQLRLAKREMHNKENRTLTNDISLEMATLQCQNAALEQKASDLTSALEQALSIQQSLNATNVKLSTENDSLQSELLMKNDELTKSGNLFSVETQQIKQDVGQALEKVEILRSSLNDASDENCLLANEIRHRDQEIVRLNELNKGLQSSVSRLLEDLNKASKTTTSSDVNITSLVLKKFDSILSSPPAFKAPIQQMKITQPTQLLLPTPHTYEAIPTPSTHDVASSPTASLPTTATCSVAPVVGSVSSISLPATDSVSSSMWSITSHDEKDFTAGLASLDADIQRLQNSLRGLNATH